MVKSLYFFHLAIFFISAPVAQAAPAISAQASSPFVFQLASPAAAEADATGPDARYYSDSFTPLREDVRAFERDPSNRYTYCVRNTATYECLSYGSDGAIRRRQSQATAHGTAFAYQHDGEETRLLTNEHVVFWPRVTDAEHHVEDVPLGCKLIGQKLQIVDNEDDEYEVDDVPLTRVIDDPALDVAVVRAKGKLRLLPYRLGRSAALSTGDVVIVRGFPLGVFAAYNTGKVINTLDEDRYKHWDHSDFIIDAQLSSGNSGSPVLALNRKTGEYELVGVFHASYTRASSLNAVIAIDQLREVMFQLKRSSRPRSAVGFDQLSESAARALMLKALADKDFVPYIGFGALLVRIHPVENSLLFEIFSKRFPLDDHRIAFVLDAPDVDGAGKLQQVWFGNDRGYRAYSLAELDAESTGALKLVRQRLYELSSSTIAYRELMARVPDSRQALKQRDALQRTLLRAASQDAELTQQFLDIRQQKAPSTITTALSMAEVFAQIQAPANPTRTVTSLAKADDK